MILALLAAAVAPDCSDGGVGMAKCAAADVRTADAAMNAQWKRTLAAMQKRDKAAAGQRWRPRGPGYAQVLLDAQRKWLAYRDAECISQGYAFHGGSGEPLLVLSCKADLTQARTKQLEIAAREN